MSQTLTRYLPTVLVIYFTAMNLTAFVLFGWDKRCAKKDRRRVRESTLLWLCTLGGSLGGLLAMRLFHHKTLKKRFAIGVPVMLAVQAGLLIFLGWRFMPDKVYKEGTPVIIDYNSMEETLMPNFLGGEGALRAKMFSDERNRILHGVLEPGCSIGYHTHDTSSEIIYILSGRGKVKLEEGEEKVKAGECHYCPKGCSHSLINDSDGELEFFAVVPQQ